VDARRHRWRILAGKVRRFNRRHSGRV